ncbi:MAG: hypothetical protein M1818_001932 [Claussenomyces sp. TS43310]|nr:MAG: hypothetical protein M1818_001932 [Claussenomyces sp. TS43310]
MASPSTRSLRRAEGLRLDPSRRRDGPNTTCNGQIQSNTGRRKRAREITEKEDHAQPKRTRITLNGDSRPKEKAKRRSRVVINPDATSDVSPQRSTHPTTQVNHAAAARTSTKHAEKFGAGIKHELDRLQPSHEDKKNEKRKLRSQEGTRFKSDLSLYFPDYDVVIGNEPEETHFLNADTPIIITDSNLSSTPISPKSSPSKPQRSKTSPRVRSRCFPSVLFETLNDSQRVDFTFLNKTFKSNSEPDPLSDSYYEENGHRRQERLEKSIRNTEKGRAQHEKDQVIRLLEGLQGHDWLKVMGVSGITEGKKKDYEPARDHFIRGCQAIVEKFRTWREEEKRRKLKKERALAEAEADEDDEAELSDGDPPDYSDVDHAAARQLHEEAIARSGPLALAKEKKLKMELVKPAIGELEKDFVSFYSKPYLREAAIGKHRRSGRSISAWGQPIPDVEPRDFDLPEEFKTKDTLEANARSRRRHRRVNSRD